MSNKHSKLPFRTSKTFPKTIICNSNTETEYLEKNTFGGRVVAQEIRDDNDRDFILKACNNHYDLIEFVKETEQIVKDNEEYMTDSDVILNKIKRLKENLQL